MKTRPVVWSHAVLVCLGLRPGPPFSSTQSLAYLSKDALIGFSYWIMCLEEESLWWYWHRGAYRLCTVVGGECTKLIYVLSFLK
jgi:hypothetical protein